MGEVPCRDVLGARQTQEAQKCFVLGLGVRVRSRGSKERERSLLTDQQETLLLLPADLPLPPP